MRDWQAMRRLLVCCFDQENGLELVLQALSQSLPDVEMFLLTARQTADSTILPKLVFTPLSRDASSQQTFFNFKDIISYLQSCDFEAAIILTAPLQSPYTIAYLCYLAKIPIRIGQSLEFAGSTLSICITPPVDPVSPIDYHLHLLRAVGLLANTDNSILEQGTA